VTYLRLEFVGPRLVSVIGDVDLTGDEAESNVAVRLRRLEAKIAESPAVAGAVLSLSVPDEPSLVSWRQDEASIERDSARASRHHTSS
jgi:hypothetical protein